MAEPMKVCTEENLQLYDSLLNDRYYTEDEIDTLLEGTRGYADTRTTVQFITWEDTD